MRQKGTFWLPALKPESAWEDVMENDKAIRSAPEVSGDVTITLSREEAELLLNPSGRFLSEEECDLRDSARAKLRAALEEPADE